MILFYIVLCSFILSLLFTPITVKISARFNIFKPVKSEQGKPCIGGVGIYIAFFVAVLSSLFFIELPAMKISGAILASFIILLLGLVDDIKDLRPLLKILGQLLGILILICSDFSLK